MNFQGIETDSMLNGDGLRVILWVSGCEHHCPECQNPQTHNVNSGRKFTFEDECELYDELKKEHISGITFSGGDPLHPNNRDLIYDLAKNIKQHFPNKTIWLYTGYKFEDIYHLPLIWLCDVVVDGRYEKDLRDVNAHWVGSTNQRVIDMNKMKQIVLANIDNAIH